jgi:hypothetical protein
VNCNCYSGLPRGQSGCKNPGKRQRVSNSFQVSPGKWAKACLGSCLLASLCVVLPRLARAHDMLGSYVQHAVHLTAGAQHLDITLDLTFFEEWSARERKAMDTDGSGVITRSEQEAYLKGMETGACQQVKLFVSGREVPLASLYPPEIDLLANSRVGPAHHRLRVFFFAAAPAGLRAGDELVIDDKLWPQANILVTSQAEGRDGCRLATGQPTDAELPPAKLSRLRRITFKCLQPPSTKPPPHPEHHRGPIAAGTEPPPPGVQLPPPTNRPAL